MVSEEMVDKLKLHCDKHPHPYRIAWFKKGSEFTINKRCLINFSIGKTYKDEVWCDVILMDAFHLLLGRPWKYNIKVIHYGGKNTYTFWKDGSKIILLSLTDEGKAENMLSIEEPITKMKVMGFCYALIVQRREGEDIKIPIEVPKVLEENKDMFVVQENISFMGKFQLMTPRRRWIDNMPFQAKKWRKIAHILDSYSARPIQQMSGTMGRCSTNRKYMGNNEETFEDNNMQELRYFQLGENDAEASGGHNF